MTKSFIGKVLVFLLICFVLGITLIIDMLRPQQQPQPIVQAQVVKQEVQPIHTFELPLTPKPQMKNVQPIVDLKQQTKQIQTTPQSVSTSSPSKIQDQPQVVQQIDIAPQKDSQNKISQTNISSIPAINTDNEKICVVYGPLDIEEKSRMDIILNKYKQSNLAKVDKKTTYLIYWNLGSDKKEADKMFNRLKENGGALADPKFVLTKNENGDYVVNIVRVNTGKNVAEKLTNDLIVRANKVNTGGQWLYKALPEGYFYTIADTNKLNPKVQQSINMLIEAPKDPC